MEQNPSKINPFEDQQPAPTGNYPQKDSGTPMPGSAPTDSTHGEPETTNGNQPKQYNQPSVRSWILFLLTGFLLMLVYIYNSGHANKALRTKDKLTKELKELHSESISLESQITNASTQSALTKRLEGSGGKEITTPPIKLMRKKKEE